MQIFVVLNFILAFMVDFQSSFDPRELSMDYLLMERLAIQGVVSRNGLATRPLPAHIWNEILKDAKPKTSFDSLVVQELTKTNRFGDFTLDVPLRLHGYFAQRDTVRRYEVYTHLYGIAMLKVGKVSLYHKSAMFNRRMKNWQDLPFYDPLLDPDFRLVCFESQPVIGERESFEVRTDRAYIHFEFPFGDLEMGRDEPRFGPGFRSAVTFSGFSQPMEYLYNLRFRNRWLTFVTFNAYASDTIKWKRISGQRLELNFWRITLGFTESVVYTESDPFKYFNPLELYYIMQRRGDTNSDNLMGGIDISLFLADKAKIYGELLDDDIIITKSHPSPSKYAVLFGIHVVDPFGIDKSDLILEFTHAARFTYAHVYSDYMNTPEIIGYPFVFWGGPNADCFSLDFFKFWTPKSGVRVGVEYMRHGADDMHSGYELLPSPPPNRPNFDKFLTLRTMVFGARKDGLYHLAFEITKFMGESRKGWRTALRFDITQGLLRLDFKELLEKNRSIGLIRAFLGLQM